MDGIHNSAVRVAIIFGNFLSGRTEIVFVDGIHNSAVRVVYDFH